MPQQDPVTALKQSEKPISAVSSYTNLYNSPSNTGSAISLPLSNSNSNSAVFTNNPGLVQKATTLANKDHLCPRQQINEQVNHTNTTIDQQSHNDDHSDNESAFELNWQPQVSTDNQYSLP
ncbi:hypothetical protein CANINC_002252 [Pichia inconspicua]|uniref:Uncharacterized protein n=1 Tax=Pichia inconspicua TaxID=52247 RepID=A0A4T0X2X6_9ASCO|nr:hypothetical protein CANINC_002252 [[Candida] inconspicua]